MTQCAWCGRHFTNTERPEIMLAESKYYWGEIPEDEKVVICDPCWQAMSPELDRLSAEWRAMTGED